MKSTCCDRKKPAGIFKVLPLAILGAVVTLIVALSIEVGTVYIFGLI